MGLLSWFTKNAGKKLDNAASLLNRAQTKRNSFNTAKELGTAKEADEKVAALRKVYDDAQKTLKDLQTRQETDLAKAKRDINEAYTAWKASTVSLTDRLKSVTKLGFTKALFGNLTRTNMVQARNAKLNERLKQREKEANDASANYKQQLLDQAEAERKRKEAEEEAAKLRQQAMDKREALLKTLSGTASKQVSAVSAAPQVAAQRNKTNLNNINTSVLKYNYKGNTGSDPVAHNLYGGSRRAPRRRGTHRRR